MKNNVISSSHWEGWEASKIVLQSQLGDKRRGRDRCWPSRERSRCRIPFECNKFSSKPVQETSPSLETKAQCPRKAPPKWEQSYCCQSKSKRELFTTVTETPVNLLLKGASAPPPQEPFSLQARTAESGYRRMQVKLCRGCISGALSFQNVHVTAAKQQLRHKVLQNRCRRHWLLWRQQGRAGCASPELEGTRAACSFRLLGEMCRTIWK